MSRPMRPGSRPTRRRCAPNSTRRAQTPRQGGAESRGAVHAAGRNEGHDFVFDQTAMAAPRDARRADRSGERQGRRAPAERESGRRGRGGGTGQAVTSSSRSMARPSPGGAECQSRGGRAHARGEAGAEGEGAVLRDGKNKDFVVVARPDGGSAARSTSRMPDDGAIGRGDGRADAADARVPRASGPAILAAWSWPASRRSWARISVSATACWWCRRRENAAFKLEDGDVIQSIDGRKPEDGAHAMRILRSYKSGEKLTIDGAASAQAADAGRDHAGAAGVRRRTSWTSVRPMPPVPPVPAGAAVSPGTAAEPDLRAAAMAVNSPPCVAATSPTSFPKNSSPSSRSRNDPRAGC